MGAKRKLLTRTYPVRRVEVRQDEDKLTFEGYAAVFDELSVEFWGWQEKIAPGAFRKTLEEKPDVRFLWNHNPDLVLARTTNGSLRLAEDDVGLRVEADMAPTSYAQDLSILLERGDISQMSFGFWMIRDEWDESREPLPLRTLKEVSLDDGDVAAVTYPAYKGTSGEVRTVTAFVDLPVGDREAAWDADAADTRVRRWASADDSGDPESIDWARYRRAFFWYDSDEPEVFGSYKLGFADIVDGELRAIPRGVFAAAAVLQGGRGGVDIPAEDLEPTQAHVARYYQKMRDEWDDDSIVAPWDRARQLRCLASAGPESLRAAFAELREGKVLSGTNKQLVQSAIEALQAILEAAEPAEDKSRSAADAAVRAEIARRGRELELLELAI